MTKYLQIIVVCILIFIAGASAYCAPTEPLYKWPDEVIPQYHEFLRSDGDGWLSTGETISSGPADYSVKTYERSTGTETTSTMISAVAVIDGNASRSRVTYKLRGGTAGKIYTIIIMVKTSAGHTFEDQVQLRVK